MALVINSGNNPVASASMMMRDLPTPIKLHDIIDQGHIDYCYGVKIGCDLRNDLVNLWVYDRDSNKGAGHAKHVIDALRKERKPVVL